MYRLKENTVKTYDIANYLNRKTEFGKDYDICFPSSPQDAVDKSFVFFSDADRSALDRVPSECLVLMRPIKIESDQILPEVIFTDNPERDYYLIVKEFFIDEVMFAVDPSVELHSSVTLGVNVNIGRGCKIGENVVIGNNTYIDKNVCISDNVTIGSGCYFKAGAIIGSESFKFIKEDDRYSYVPFFGDLIIGDNVWVGSNTVVERPAIGKANIESGVKIDDLVEIGANSQLGENVQIAAGSIVSRDVSIGSNTFIGINTVVNPNVVIGENITTGAGCVVIKNLDSDRTYVGNPAKQIKLG